MKDDIVIVTCPIYDLVTNNEIIDFLKQNRLTIEDFSDELESIIFSNKDSSIMEESMKMDLIEVIDSDLWIKNLVANLIYRILQVRVIGMKLKSIRFTGNTAMHLIWKKLW